MALMSMTGFARSEVVAGAARFVWELKSVNGRGLEVRVRLPSGLERLEAPARQCARESLSRGTCQFALQEDRGAAAPMLRLNEGALALAVAAARRLAAEEGIGLPTADGILALPGVLQPVDSPSQEDEETDGLILGALEEAIGRLVAARREEGGRLHAIVAEQLERIEALTGEAATLAEEAPEALKARIADQVALLAGNPGLDPERLHQEAVLLAARADVREEIDRLKSHVAAARKQIASSGPVGRPLDFLAQEFNREANTLCSKAFDRRLVAVGMELRAVIDQLREQVQNLE